MIIILAVVAVVVGGFVTYNVLNPSQHVTEAEYAHVGDCLSGTSVYKMEVRPCDDPKATYKVVRSFDGWVSKKSIQASCAGAPGATTYYFKEQNHVNGHGNLLCLAPINR